MGQLMRLVDTGQVYRSMSWLAHVAVVVGVVLCLTNIVSVATIIALLPLKEVKPMFLTVKNAHDQVVHVEPLGKTSQGYDLLMESLVRQYVMLREPVNLQSDVERWQQMARFSSDKVNQTFYAMMNKDNPKSPFEARRKEGVTRAVYLRSTTSLAPSAPNVWQVEWEAVDIKDNQEIGRSVWQSTITAECQEKDVRLEDQYLNPVGFTVTHYNVAKKQESK